MRNPDDFGKLGAAWTRVALLAFALGPMSGCLFISLGLTGSERELEEIVIEPAARWLTDEKILIIDLSGLITTSSRSSLTRSSRGTAEQLRDQLEKAAADRNVAAVVLRINSPGGGVTASDICHREQVAFRRIMAKDK